MGEVLFELSSKCMMMGEYLGNWKQGIQGDRLFLTEYLQPQGSCAVEAGGKSLPAL